MSPELVLVGAVILVVVFEFVFRWDDRKQKEWEGQMQQGPVISETETKRKMDQLKAEIGKLEEEAAQYFSADQFAKQQKLKRKIIPMQQQIEELQVEYEKEVQEQTKAWEVKQRQIPQRKTLKPQILLGQFSILATFVVVFFWRDMYFRVQGIGYEQLYPINYLIARPVEEEVDSTEIKLSFWLIQCFNAAMFTKEQLGLAVHKF